MNTPRLIPIFTTQGELAAFLGYPYIFSRQGEWIGWVNAERQVYSVGGQYVGWMTDDPRIVRRQADHLDKSRRRGPQAPGRIKPPASVPLPPMMSELSYGMVDVLQDEPERLSPSDFGDRARDLD